MPNPKYPASLDAFITRSVCSRLNGLFQNQSGLDFMLNGGFAKSCFNRSFGSEAEVRRRIVKSRAVKS
jgi:hypothetical protein